MVVRIAIDTIDPGGSAAGMAHPGAVMKKLAVKLVSVCVLMPVVVMTPTRLDAQMKYIPQAELCADNTGALCPLLAAYIGPDGRLGHAAGYDGLYGMLPTQSSGDLETPFDNMAWQMFVALNWAANAVKQKPDKGLTTPGQRVWQTYRKVSKLFGDSPDMAGCTSAQALPVLSIGSDESGNPAPNNEEYLQASTNRPLIDVNGNWTIFERRVNDIEANYLLAPNGQSSQTLTTSQGQKNFVNAGQKVEFTTSDTVQTGKNGAIEIKAAWRIIDRSKGDDPSRYFTQLVQLAVAKDLVHGGQQICATVTVGLVGMHIIQRNPFYQPNASLKPQWIWASFEHVDNAPMALAPCNVRNGCGDDPSTNWINQPSCGPAAPDGQVRYSFFRHDRSVLNTNVRPRPFGFGPERFPWNPKQPYAQGGVLPETAAPQATRCWSIYLTTALLNGQWQSALAAVHSVFQNYLLIGTQWGGDVEPEQKNPVPANAVPGMLSNITLETYIQNNIEGNKKAQGGPGSCVSCHSFAKLPVEGKPSADFSFLPGLVDRATARSQIETAE